MDEACCWGKENHDRLQALLRPAPALPTWGTTKIPSRARAGTSVNQPHDPDPVPQWSLLGPSRRLRSTYAIGPGPDNPGSPPAHRRFSRPRVACPGPVAPSSPHHHFPHACCLRTPRQEARRSSILELHCAGLLRLYRSHHWPQQQADTKASKATASADTSPHAREHTTRLSGSQGRRAAAAIRGHVHPTPASSTAYRY